MLQKRLVSILIQLCRHTSAVECLLRLNDLSLLFGAISSPCPPYNKIWRKAAADCLLAIFRHSLSNEVIHFVHTKGCVGFCIRNIQLSVDQPPLDLVEIFATIFCCLKDSSDISQVLSDLLINVYIVAQIESDIGRVQYLCTQTVESCKCLWDSSASLQALVHVLLLLEHKSLYIHCTTNMQLCTIHAYTCTCIYNVSTTIYIHTCTCSICRAAHVHLYVHVHGVWSVVGSSPTRSSSFFLGKVTALGVLCCFALFVCLTLLASFFLPSHLSFKTCIVHLHSFICTCTCIVHLHSLSGADRRLCSVRRTQVSV